MKIISLTISISIILSGLTGFLPDRWSMFMHILEHHVQIASNDHMHDKESQSSHHHDNLLASQGVQQDPSGEQSSEKNKSHTHSTYTIGDQVYSLDLSYFLMEKIESYHQISFLDRESHSLELSNSHFRPPRTVA